MIGHEEVYITRYGVTVEEVMAKYGSRYRLKVEDGMIQCPVGGWAKKLAADLKLDAQLAGTGVYAPAYLAKQAEARAEAEWQAAMREVERAVRADDERAAAIADLQDALTRPELATPNQLAYIARLVRAGADPDGVIRPGTDLSRLSRREASAIIDSLTGYRERM